MYKECKRPEIFLYADFDVPALCRLASRLRGGRLCHCSTSQRPNSGSFSWSITLSFSDNVEWILRAPRHDGAIRSMDTNLILLASEAATLKYIRSNSDILVPEVFTYRYRSSTLI